MQFRPFPRRTPGTLGPSNQRGALPHTPARRSRGPHAPLRSSQARRARLPLYGAYNENKILVMRRIAVQGTGNWEPGTEPETEPENLKDQIRCALNTRYRSKTSTRAAPWPARTNLIRTCGAPAGENSPGPRCARPRLIAFARINASWPFAPSMTICSVGPGPKL